MMKRGVALAAMLLIPVLSGCLTVFDEPDDDDPDKVVPADPGYDPSEIRVSGFDIHDVTVPSFDGQNVPTVIYEPRTADSLPDGTPVTWPVVVFLHGWGFAKEQWQNFPLGLQQGEQPTDLLAEFALEGFLAVAYDARGFGQSTAPNTVAGPAEMADLRAVIDYIKANHPANDKVGVTGTSYGGGQSLLGLSKFSDIDAAAIHYGWTDLYDGVIPGNVPKLEWAQMLFAVGTASNKGPVSGTLVAQWYPQLYSRDDMDGLEAAMDIRSVGDAAMERMERPVFWCQGMQETLFPQFHRGMKPMPGFTRAYIFTGGHSAVDAECWDRTKDWFLFFLRGIDTEVDTWPALETVDAASSDLTTFSEKPTSEMRVHYLREPNLGALPSNSTFTIEQRILANPFQEPGFIWDTVGAPNNAIPEQFRQDPQGVFFETSPVSSTETVVGAPMLELHLDGDQALPFQVTVALFKDSGDRQQILSRGAYAALDEDDVGPNGTVQVRMDWTKTDLDPGDSLVLKVAANDPSTYMPLFANYEVTFTGHSNIELPFFSP